MIMLISVVLPVYNVDKFLAQCLDTVCGQTFSDIEIIIINDGSTDSSAKICDDYASRDARIKVFHLSNSGVAAARERGVKEATSDWIAFVDPDDSLPLDALEILSSYIEAELDIISGGYYHKNFRTGLLGYHYNRNQRLNHEQYVKQLFNKQSYPSPWGKIYRRTLFGESSFPRFKTGQDCLMNFELSRRVRNVRKVNKPVYCYLVDRVQSSFTDYKPNLDYETAFNQTLEGILAGSYDKLLVRWKLDSVRKLILAKVRFSLDDSRIKEIATSAESVRLNPGDYFVYLSLKFRFVQRLRYLCYMLWYLNFAKLRKAFYTVWHTIYLSLN